jgi:tetratricopeptide (TPR) repeat protein
MPMPDITLEQAIQLAIQRHQAGRLAEAEGIYRQILARQPNEPNALHFLGLIAQQSRKPDLAAQLIRQSLAVSPNNVAAYFNLGNVLKSQGKIDEAAGAYSKAIQLKPDYAEAHFELGMMRVAQGNLQSAAEAFSSAIRLKPDNADAHNNLGNILTNQGRLEEAAASYSRAIALRPDYAVVHSNLGNVLSGQEKLDEAIASYRRAIELQPDYAVAYLNLSNTLKKQNKLGEATAACRDALKYDPNYAEAYLNLANILMDQGKLTEAEATCAKAVALKPDMALFHYNLANILKGQGKLEQAIVEYSTSIRLNPKSFQAMLNMGNAFELQGNFDKAESAIFQALAVRPDYPEALLNLGNLRMLQGRHDDAEAAIGRAGELAPEMPGAHLNKGLHWLVRGRLADGWPEYEWRWQCPTAFPPPRGLPEPQWLGEELNGRAILLHCEQGIGDAIQFVRYAPLVAARGGKIFIECPPTLTRLFQNTANLGAIITKGDPLPRFELQCPLMSLPLAFKNDLKSIPAAVPYLFPDPKLVETWGKKLKPSNGKRKIGLVWAGSPTFRNDLYRSMLVSKLKALASVKNADFYSLQKKSSSSPIDFSQAGIELIDLTADLNDFADTAALISHLDLVIGVDTAVVHLAGAMAKPVWLLVPFNPDWRWMLNRSDSPWYPTMRIFRQTKLGDWDSVMQRVSETLVRDVIQIQ